MVYSWWQVTRASSPKRLAARELSSLCLSPSLHCSAQSLTLSLPAGHVSLSQSVSSCIWSCVRALSLLCEKTHSRSVDRVCVFANCPSCALPLAFGWRFGETADTHETKAESERGARASFLSPARASRRPARGRECGARARGARAPRRGTIDEKVDLKCNYLCAREKRDTHESTHTDTCWKKTGICNMRQSRHRARSPGKTTQAGVRIPKASALFGACHMHMHMCMHMCARACLTALRLRRGLAAVT